MKRLSKLTLTAALLLMCSTNTFAQKFGYINSSELIMAMPERVEIENKLKAYREELNSQLEAIGVEFNTKLEEYQKNEATYSDLIKQTKEKELADLQERWTEFNNVLIPQDLQKKQNELMSPILEKARNAINEVSQSQGFTMVFDMDAGAILYQDDKTVTNIMSMVKEKLGIKDTPTPPSASSSSSSASATK